MAAINNEATQFIYDVVAEGCIIGDNSLGIVEREGDFPIVPKDLVLTHKEWDECQNGDCGDCENGGCCNNCYFEEVKVSKIGGRTSITFVRWCGHQLGSIWTNWQRSY